MNTYEMLEEAAHRAYTRGIQTGNGGNLSARADFGMIVNPAAAPLPTVWQTAPAS